MACLQTFESILLPWRRGGNHRSPIVQIRKDFVFGLLESDGDHASQTKPKDEPKSCTWYQGPTTIIAHLRETKEHNLKTETNNAFPESLRRPAELSVKTR